MGAGRTGNPGDPELLDHRMRIWRDRALRGVYRADIASELGMSVVALDRMVCRQRAAGNALAVYHLFAQFKNPDPPRRSVVNRQYRARVRDRERAERARATLSQASTDC